MDEGEHRAEGVSYAPSPPEKFCGRERERERLATILSRAAGHGQAVMISGPPGIGKSSLLNRLAYEVQENPVGGEAPVLRGEVFDLPGMLFSVFRDLLKDLRGHTVSGRFGGILGTEGMKEAVRYADDVLAKYAAPVEPVGLLSKTGEEIIGIFARSPEVGYDRVRQAFDELLQELGRLMAGTGRAAAVLLDDVHLASSLDRRLLLDTIRDLPPGILLAFTCRTGDAAGPGQEILEIEIAHMPLSGLQPYEIRELGERRFALPIDDRAAAALLDGTGGDPFSLMACFNVLRHRGMTPSRETITALLAGANDPAGLAFSALPGPERRWAEGLSVLNPPFPVPVMACMLDVQATDVTGRLQESSTFRRLPGGEYAFAHPLLQEHCRLKLTPGTRVSLNTRAADCFERSLHRLSGRLHVLLSLACHFFFAREYEKAADLNLELGLRFYHREDHDTGLMLTERAIVSAEHLGDSALLATAREQRDLIRRETTGTVRPVQ